MEFLEINEIGANIEMVLINLVNKSEFWFNYAQLETKLVRRQPNMVPPHRFWPAQLLVYNEIIKIKYDVLISVPHGGNLGTLQFILTKYNNKLKL